MKNVFAILLILFGLNVLFFDCADSFGSDNLQSAQALIKASNWREALQQLKVAADLHPENADTWSLMGLCYMQLGKFSEAKDAYSKAKSLSKGVNSVPGNIVAASAKTKEQLVAEQKRTQDIRNNYMAGVRRLLKRNWHPTRNYLVDTVIVKFKVDKEGMILNPSIKKSSNDSTVDSMAMSAVRDTSNVGALPPELGDEIDVELSFDSLTFM